MLYSTMVLRNYLSKIGEQAKDAPIYWKYGCWFFERKTSSQALIETSWDDDRWACGLPARDRSASRVKER